jgi:hypothetical protein
MADTMKEQNTEGNRVSSGGRLGPLTVRTPDRLASERLASAWK